MRLGAHFIRSIDVPSLLPEAYGGMAGTGYTGQAGGQDVGGPGRAHWGRTSFGGQDLVTIKLVNGYNLSFPSSYVEDFQVIGQTLKSKMSNQSR